MNSTMSLPSISKSRVYGPKKKKKRRIYHQIRGQTKGAQPIPASRIKRFRLPSVNWRRESIGCIISYWWLEFLSCIIIIVTFTGLITILHNYQDLPLPDWPRGLTLNTILSLFGVIFKSPILLIAAEGIGQLKWSWLARRRPLSDLSIYDEASRGPWGATKMLWKIRGRHILGSLGALITVLALGIDPFTQAVVSYYGCSVKDTTKSSSISRLNSFYVDSSQDGLANGIGLSASLRFAIDDSFSDPNTVLPKFTCSTEDCRFTQPYHSIGVCSRCSDVSDLLISTCPPHFDPDDGERSENFILECNYTLTSDIGNKGAFNSTAGFVDATPAPGTVDVHWQLLSINKQPLALTQNGSRDFNTTGPLDKYISSTIDVVSFPPVLGCRCWIYLCTRTYTATIDSGVLRETLHSTSSNWSTDWVAGTVRVDCLDSEVQSHLLFEGYISKETEWMAWDGTYINGTQLQE